MFLGSLVLELTRQRKTYYSTACLYWQRIWPNKVDWMYPVTAITKSDNDEMQICLPRSLTYEMPMRRALHTRTGVVLSMRFLPQKNPSIRDVQKCKVRNHIRIIPNLPFAQFPYYSRSFDLQNSKSMVTSHQVQTWCWQSTKSSAARSSKGQDAPLFEENKSGSLWDSLGKACFGTWECWGRVGRLKLPKMYRLVIKNLINLFKAQLTTTTTEYNEAFDHDHFESW